MLGLDWSELALIAVVAVVVIGPKDLPEAVRGIAKGIQKLRRMAGEFQGQVDEVVREAKLEDVRNQINEIRNFDFRSVVEKEIDKDGSIRKTFTEDPIGNPLRDAWNGTSTGTGAVVTPPPADVAGAAPVTPPPAPPAPAFIPPGTLPPLPVAAAPPASPAPAPPAFVPPAPQAAAPYAPQAGTPHAPQAATPHAPQAATPPAGTTV